jgi:hypothetical protein
MPDEPIEEKPQTDKPTNPPGGSSNKTIMIIVVVVVGLLILGGAGYFVQQQFTEKAAEDTIEKATGADVDVSDGGDKVTIETDEGKVTVGKDDVPDAFPSDITIYSGSEVTATTETSDGVSVQLKTSDSVSTVNSFYKSDLKSNGWTLSATATEDDSGYIMATKNKKTVVLTITPDTSDNKTVITIITGESTE